VVEIEKSSQIFLCAGAVPPGREQEIRANAQLASAAPDLYAALEELSDALEGARAANPEASIEFFDELVEIEPGWRQRCRAALLKARGETDAQ
jgi:hypothetical protein